jgi:DNA-binding response OmpR family regulator
MMLSEKNEYDLSFTLLRIKESTYTTAAVAAYMGNMLDDQYDSNFIDLHIKNLRKKLNDHAPLPGSKR